MERHLNNLVSANDLEGARKILKNHPGVDVNALGPSGRTCLHEACINRSMGLISLLLDHPSTDPNKKSLRGVSPFESVCFRGDLSFTRRLLEDPRLVPTIHPEYNHNPYQIRTYIGHFGISNYGFNVIKAWIASGRSFNLPPDDEEAWVYRSNAYNDAHLSNTHGIRAEMVTLMEAFRDLPDETRQAVRLGEWWKWPDEHASALLAPVVFLSDGVARVSDFIPEGSRFAGAGRFLRIAKRLPLEIQMTLCYRAAGTSKTLVPLRCRELEFRRLATHLLRASPV
jgi:hypothetical protein